MSSPPPPRKIQTILTNATQAVKTIPGKVNFSQLLLNPNARVPELWVQDADSDRADVYPLVGEYYLLGRSSKFCDIVVSSSLASKKHLSLTRDRHSHRPRFILEDAGSSNGIYQGKRRVRQLPLRHGDFLTLGPPDLAKAVRIQYVNPPPWYQRLFHWGCYGLFGVSLVAAVWIGLEWQNPKLQRSLEEISITGPVAVYARDGETLLREESGNTHVEIPRLEQFDEDLVAAAIASEDSRFYWHLGIDPIGVVRAMVVNLRGGEIREGASTITQQLARSLFRDYVGTEDSAARKLREAAVALRLEMFYSKDQLLKSYLNQVFLGLNLYGFEDAAQFYFDKSARDLTLSEAATLVGILPAPNSFNPVQNYERAIRQRNGVLQRMRTLGMISPEEADRARRSPIEVNPKAKEIINQTIAPYFYDRVLQELENLLGQSVAAEGNWIVQTTLDPQMQAIAEKTVRHTLATTGQRLRFQQGALVALNGKTGAVRAMVGGADYAKSQYNRATQAARQPGSTFKAFAYAAALQSGISPHNTYSCEPLFWQGRSFRGCERSGGRDRVDMYRGLAQSENVIALRIAQQVGLQPIIELAHTMGIRSELTPAPGLVLGSSEVTLLELTGAYTAFVDSGVRHIPHTILRVWDSSNCTNPQKPSTCREIYNGSHKRGQQVLDPGVAQTMTELLRGVVERGTGTAAAAAADSRSGILGKTGTTDRNRDLWFVGYLSERQLLAGVWLGNDDNQPTYGSSAQAAQLWGKFVRQLPSPPSKN
ncbi:PBP1A family penicillin-binding protein [Geitlerinema sp. PCC 9228]|jgi:1A family penicillin-binding protein|uniref:PBP1A family penicillin-binding protein n=1 Tax=Geitlerinema sp. PCC 9228 TaxID=111611 RepID=UPI0008F9C815|nr:PBP1A family penicillin-binding protein [Geitlerinema sp. PCC 9228]